MSFVFTAALALCSPTNLILPPGVRPSREDYAAVVAAQKRCPILYPRSPCAKSVERRRHLSYWVICSATKKGT